ncbi:MAG: DUF1688 family protein [Alphaproteobacteria bacterium]|nr:DUF1688 family protein [Alphaproteobacteria bacterium]HJP23185.1 DUF1688 family protein [Alphaproteobacteria bacterium]
MTKTLAALATPEAIRERCTVLLALAERGDLANFRLVLEKLEHTADLVAGVTRQNYPNLRIPLHSRWRHFAVAGHDLWAERLARNPDLTGPARARSEFELAIVSVLLDAGAGAAWRYQDHETGFDAGRSEGLALASLRLFEAGGLSNHPDSEPLRADTAALSALTAADLGRAFQVSETNPLVGLAGRAALLNALGRAVGARWSRLGELYDQLAAVAVDGCLPARSILVAVLDAFNAIWPSGLVVDEVALGDVGRHAQADGEGASAGLVPFHKLSQWLSYSLIEPLQWAGLTVTDLDGLTGLAEYRNGGLFIDTGVLVPRDAAALDAAWPADSELVVEWRALTVALLDRLAPLVRQRLGLGPDQLPLAAVLQGGSWAAGRRLAEEKRGGQPPIAVDSDGTLF